MHSEVLAWRLFGGLAWLLHDELRSVGWLDDWRYCVRSKDDSLVMFDGFTQTVTGAPT